MDTPDGLFIHIQCILDKLLDIYGYPIILSSSCKQPFFDTNYHLCLSCCIGPFCGAGIVIGRLRVSGTNPGLR